MDRHGPRWRSAWLRCYAHLNELLPARCRQPTCRVRFRATPTLLTLIEGEGIPHSEVNLALVDGTSASWNQRLYGGERIALYPALLTLQPDPGTLTPWHQWGGGFILDVHLGKLARRLRLLGIDCCYRNDFADDVLIDRALAERRLILTRDLGLLKQGRVRLGYYVRATNPDRQVQEVISRFPLDRQLQPFSRCLQCNGELTVIERDEIAERLPDNTRRYYRLFLVCSGCGQIYWQGSHYNRLKALVCNARDGADDPPPNQT